MKLTPKQLTILEALDAYETPPSARRLADRLETPAYRAQRWRYSQVYDGLRRLQTKGAVERAEGDGWVRWRVTPKGRAAMSEQGEHGTITTT